jgi:hypothetical protein
MNKLAYLIILFLLFSSCKKDCEDSPVAGQWEWYKATGGIGNIYQTPQNTGRSWQLILNSDYTFTQTGDLMPTGNGTYTLTEETTLPGWKRTLVNINLNGMIHTYSYTMVSQDSLRLDDHIEADGFSYFLVRE